MRHAAIFATALIASALGVLGVFYSATAIVILLLGVSTLGAMVGGVVVAASKPGERTTTIVVTFACLVPWLTIPVGRAISRRVVRDAQDYCNALIDVARQTHARTGHWPTTGPLEVPGRPLPWLLQPGRSVRYGFTFGADDHSFQCRFPDPTGARTSWQGEFATRWVWDHLLD